MLYFIDFDIDTEKPTFWILCFVFCCYVPSPRRTFWNSASVCPMAQLLGYRHVSCMQLSQRRPTEMWGLRTRPRMDVDPPRFCIELPSTGDISSHSPRGDTLLSVYVCILTLPTNECQSRDETSTANCIIRQWELAQQYDRALGSEVSD